MHASVRKLRAGPVSLPRLTIKSGENLIVLSYLLDEPIHCKSPVQRDFQNKFSITRTPLTELSKNREFMWKEILNPILLCMKVLITRTVFKIIIIIIINIFASSKVRFPRRMSRMFQEISKKSFGRNGTYRGDH